MNSHQDQENLDRDAQVPFTYVESKGWPIWLWILVFFGALIFFIKFGTVAKSKVDQSFLIGAIIFQAIIGTFLLRIVTAIFKWNSVRSFLGKLVVVAVLCVVLFGLTLCSSFIRTGWLGA